MNQILHFFKNLFNSSDWPRRWHCGKWTEFHGWLYIISDLAIWSAYFTIPIVIIRYVSRKKNIRFIRLYFLFAAFILACGATHFLDAVAFWIPVYRLSALVRFITGVISWVTVFYLVKYLPVIFSLRSQSALEAEIEERKKTELALKKSRKDYELLVGGVKDYAIFMLDIEGKVASWNNGAANIKGYTAEEIIGKSINIFYTEEELQRGEPARNLQMALEHGRYETTGWRVRKDKSVFWADIVFSPLYDEDNQFYGYAKVTRDITEKRKAEERILFLASIARNIQDPFISTDNNGNITRWNHAAELLLEWNTDEVIGKNAGALLQVDYMGVSRKMIIDLLDEKNFWQGEVIYHTKSGRPVSVLITASHLKDSEGNITGNLALVRDITERKNAEDELRKLNEELEAFSYSISHDLRAPLRSIIGFTSILEEDYSSKLDDEARRITSVIKDNTAKMGVLIDDLLSFSRLGRQQIIKANLHTGQMVKEVIAELGIKNAGKQVNWIIEPLPDVEAHPTTLRQVWVNLLSNAVKYSNKQQQAVIEVGTIPGVNETIFFVKDNGVGFSEAYSDKLFKVFQRLHNADDFEGTGVGLAIVERIISKHGGKVWAKGEPGKGACFFFSLPSEAAL